MYQHPLFVAALSVFAVLLSFELFGLVVWLLGAARAHRHLARHHRPGG